ncbi:hypothetical protein BRPE64_ECDS03280 (plasmid) [Caballeronia insecticola]|uniref:Uncharacterized protein n=1 Tax=Caballeronia insecticola TaxID=758793 RepID=A0A060PRZ4_9BURK|nr:hypothetical protein BRPE64_ECDS03280 [Caballeronia insecticola]
MSAGSFHDLVTSRNASGRINEFDLDIGRGNFTKRCTCIVFVFSLRHR